MTRLDEGGRAPVPMYLNGLLLVSIYAFVAALMFGRGVVWTTLHVCAALTAMIFALNWRNWRRLWSRSMLWYSIMAAWLFVGGILASGEELADHYHINLLAGAVPVMALLVLRVEPPLPSHAMLVATMALVFVLSQAAALLIFPGRAGLFSNIHYLSLYSALAAPVLVFLLCRRADRTRWLFALALAVDVSIVLQTQSRPAYLALMTGAAVVLPFLRRGSRWPALALIVVLPAAVYVTGLFGVDQRVDDLLENLAQDERVALWSEAGRMQLDSSPKQWLLGHGFGRFHQDYQAYSSFQGADERFHYPHNFLMELLYSHGLVGLTLGVAAFAGYVSRLITAIRASRERDERRFGLLLLSLVAVHIAHTFLTLPMFSRAGFFSLSLILGTSFQYFRSVLPGESFHAARV